MVLATVAPLWIRPWNCYSTTTTLNSTVNKLCTLKLTDYHEQRRFCQKAGETCFFDRRNLNFCYQMSGAWIQARKADDVSSCVYQLVLCELVFKYIVK